MKNWAKFLAFVCGLTIISAGAWAGAFEAKCTPFQWSVFHPVELFGPQTNVTGLRLNTIYGNNPAVTGLDLGAAGMTDRLTGAQIGALNTASVRLTGAQIGCCNMVGSENPRRQSQAVGAQIGWVNLSKAHYTGTQIGVTNLSDNDFHGIQFGLVNCVETSTAPEGCLQIGLFNFNADGFLPFFILFNYR
ncbi:MAG: hypothetical protein PHQ27_06810 [Victivallales bacterium]|nr:hypothetical protein [Victivallales bacterium]